MICGFRKNQKEQKFNVFEFNEHWNTEPVSILERTLLERETWGLFLSAHLNLVNRILSSETSVANLARVENPFSTAEAYTLVDIVENNKNADDSFKLINTGTLDPYVSLWGEKITSYLKGKYLNPIVKKTKLKKLLPRRFDQQNSAKIITTGMRYFECFYDMYGEYLAAKTTIIIKDFNEEYYNYFLTGILNSKTIFFYLKESFSVLGIDGGINFSREIVSNIPIAPNYAQKSVYIPIAIIVKYLTVLSRKNKAVSSKFESIVDAMVYELYFPREIHATGCEVLKHLTNLPELQDDWSDEKKLATIEKVYKELSHPAHPVSIAMVKMETIEEIRIIEGKQ